MKTFAFYVVAAIILAVTTVVAFAAGVAGKLLLSCPGAFLVWASLSLAAPSVDVSFLQVLAAVYLADLVRLLVLNGLISPEKFIATAVASFRRHSTKSAD